MAIKPVKELIAEARTKIDNHPPAEAQRLADDDGALIVDIRDVRELQRDGVIPGAMHAPRGMLEFWVDPDSPYFKEVFAEDREFVLYCASSWRSALSANTLREMGLDRVSHIDGGFNGWKEADMSVVDYETWNADRKKG